MGLFSRKRAGGAFDTCSLRELFLLATGCGIGVLIGYSNSLFSGADVLTGRTSTAVRYNPFLRLSVTPLPGVVSLEGGGPPPNDEPIVGGSRVGDGSAATPYASTGTNSLAANEGLPSLHLFLAWVGTTTPPYPELARVLGDVVDGTAAGRPVVLHMMVQDAAVAGGDAQLAATLAGVTAAAAARTVAFSHVRYDFTAFKRDSPYYDGLCNDFQGNIHHQNAKEYACQFLIKPLLWEIITDPAVHYVVAIDTDMRIAGDLADVLTEAVPAMAAKGAGFALVAEQQPTYAFNSPQSARGFNGGVQVMDLPLLRASELYHSLVRVFHWVDTDPRWRPATDLGDQTLYSIFNYSHPELFVELGCHWNRQLCRAWFIIFDERTPQEALLQYERDALCAATEIRVLHGNCRSQRPGSDELAGLPEDWQPRNAVAEAHMLGLFHTFEAKVAAAKAAAEKKR